MTKEEVVEYCAKEYGLPEILVRAPGRANLIGEHTDYNDGFVLPFAVSKSIYFAARKNNTEQYSMTAANLKRTEILALDQLESESFSRYFASVLKTVKAHGFAVSGLDLVFGGDLPIGAGMSSSSSITCGFLKILDVAFGLQLSSSKMVQLAVEAEHGVGVEGGMMDQFSIIHAEQGQLILLDCFNHSYQHIDFLLEDCALVLFDTNVSHNLANTEYNARARTCKAALALIQDKEPNVGGFRDVNNNHLEHLEGKMHDRLKHVIEENLRVLHSIELLQSQDKKHLGTLLNESHRSLRDLFEVSCKELDFVAGQLQSEAGVFGARMMGGGFGGSVIALINQDRIDKGFDALKKRYEQEYDKPLDHYIIKPEQGLELLPLQ